MYGSEGVKVFIFQPHLHYNYFKVKEWVASTQLQGHQGMETT